MTKIKIISVPDCSAPESIRKDWLDVEIPLNDACAHEHKIPGVNNAKEELMYKVNGKDAISALIRAGKKDAANYWDPHKTGSLYFSKNVCKIMD